MKAIAQRSNKLDKANQNDYRRFVKKTAVTMQGEVADKTVFAIDEGVIEKETIFDGFYGLTTSLEDEDIPGILKVSAGRWEIEECFRIMKSEFKARSCFLSREKRIQAHFLICFIALLIYRILEKELGCEYTCSQIIDTLKDMDFEEVRGEGYRPLYIRTPITDALHDVFEFRTDYEILPDRSMKNIFRTTKQG